MVQVSEKEYMVNEQRRLDDLAHLIGDVGYLSMRLAREHASSTTPFCVL